MKVAEIQALCDALAGPALAVDWSGRVVAANEKARDRRPVTESEASGRSDVRACDCDVHVLEDVVGPELAEEAARALAGQRGGDAANGVANGGRVAVLPCEDNFVALIMEQPPVGNPWRARDASLDALAMLAHDLRGALGNVCGAFSLIDEDLSEDPVHGPRVAAMRGALAHFSDLIEAALDLETLTAGQISVKPRDVELRKFIGEVEAIWKPRLADAGMKLQIEVDRRVPAWIRVDPMRLKQVMFNLLSNAEAHAKASKVRILVSDAEPDSTGGDRFAITMEDDGVGFPDHVLARMRESRAHTLFGEGRRRLGLSVVHDIATSMGGDVSCANAETGGARIRIVAPAGQARSAEGVQVEALVASAHDAPSGRCGGLAEAIAQGGVRGLKALLAEDNATNQLVATQMLDKLGCAVEVASDGLEAVDMLSKGDFDFLLVDIEMPKMSGIDVLRHLRAGKAGPSELPAIALTAYAMAEHRRKVADAGADGMIAKPILGVKSFEADLVEILRRVLKSRDALRGARATDVSSPRTGGEAPMTLAAPDIDMTVFDGLIAVIGAASSDEFLERVDADLADVRLRIRNGAKAGDLSEIRAGAHILISVAGVIGARALQRMAEALHARAAAGDVEQARSLIKEVDAEFMAVAAFIYRRRAGAPRIDS